MTEKCPVGAMTVDVEDYFQVQAFAPYVDRSDWDNLPSRVQANTDRILEVFEQAGVKATFFTLGWVAERFPDIVRDIVGGGHELASHGYGHQLVHDLSPAAFRDDLLRAKGILESLGGVEIRGYRAPTFSIGSRNEWAYDVLAETGHRYSSSVYPVRHDLYGEADSPRSSYRPREGSVVEIPMTTVRLGTRNLPISGGGYFRLSPYWLYRQALRHFQSSEAFPNIFYFHPWEIDRNQPAIRQASFRAKFRHHVNIGAVPTRLHQLLRDFSWGRMDEVFRSELSVVGG